jgi:hypothetical protein
VLATNVAVTAQAAVMFDAAQFAPPVFMGVQVDPVTLATEKPVCGVTVKVAVPPFATTWLGGRIDPPLPAVAVTT